MIPAVVVLQAVWGSDFVRLAPHYAQDDRDKFDDKDENWMTDWMTEMRFDDRENSITEVKLGDRDEIDNSGDPVNRVAG